jgi:hypothetical protein
MQVNQPKEGGAEASRSPAPKAIGPFQPSLAGQRLVLTGTCDICGRSRSTRKHQQCSQIRQRRWADQWAAYQAEHAAKKATERRRYAR